MSGSTLFRQWGTAKTDRGIDHATGLPKLDSMRKKAYWCPTINLILFLISMSQNNIKRRCFFKSIKP
ncbi:hypothetical protein [Arenibacter sp. F20364]|uniref:hypothetical protein n=1 Tax=Arenibacter sp. F20364 TaxID=2926415 RepID=UPI001FF41959|nr:hypothetical protein [Arenibacter sp. F20364]MCK0191865.1 hypothetical protein [Arenibacter sp. F20364]